MSLLTRVKRRVAVFIIGLFIVSAAACGGSADPEFFRALCSILALPNGTLIAMDERGNFYRSTDDGSSFVDINSPTTNGVAGLTRAGGAIIGADAGGNFVRSLDLGLNWELSVGRADIKWNSIDYSTDETVDANLKYVLAVGSKGYLGRSLDLGVTWQYEKIADQDLNAIDCYQSMCYAVGNGGTLVGSWNGGGDWSALDSDTDVDLRGVGIFNAMQVWAVGGAPATITYKIDEGVWQKHDFKISGSVNYFTDVYFRSATDGILIGDGDLIFKTADGGQNLEKITVDDGVKSNALMLKQLLGGLDFGADPLKLYGVGSNGTILRSSNFFDDYVDLSLRYSYQYKQDDSQPEMSGDDSNDSGGSSGDSSGLTPTGEASFTLDKYSLRYDHLYGISLCPDLIGSIKVTNGTDYRQAVSVVKPSDAPLKISSEMFNIDSGMSKSFDVLFSCDEAKSQEETLQINAYNYYLGSEDLDTTSKSSASLLVGITVKF